MPAKSISIRCCLLLALVALAAACSPAAPAAAPTPQAVEETTLTVSGSGSVSALLSAVELTFEKETPGYNLNVLSGTGTGGGVKGVLDGSLDIAAMARAAKDDETAQGVEYLKFGDTGVAILVHPDVDVDNLTQAQVKAIFTGEITNWSEVGGQDLEMIVYVRDEEESTTILLRELIFGDTPFPETVAGVLTNVDDMVAAVEGTPGAIGFGSWTAVMATGRNVAAAMLDGVQPDDPDYAAIQPVGIGYLKSHEETVQPLVAWLVSEDGQTMLQQLGVIGIQ